MEKKLVEIFGFEKSWFILFFDEYKK